MKTYLLRYSNLEPEFAQAMCILASIAFIFCGIGMFIYYFKNKNKKTVYYSGNNLFAGVYFFLWGSATLPFAIKQNMYQYFIVSAFVIGFLLIIIGIFQLSYLKKCTEKVHAKLAYMDSWTYRHKTVETPVFSYKYNGEEYTVKSLQVFSSKVVAHIKCNPECEIYINPENPMMNIYTTRIGKMQILPFILGLVCIIIAVLMYCFPVVFI